jgi:(p)ppGpp synthase/HD superfamily hydrolase
MKFTIKIINAISQAAIWHRDQVRKDFEKTPYIAHPFSVMLTLLEFTNDEDVLIASLFHDVLEDVDLKLAEIIEKEYGPKVIKIVKALSEDKDPKKQTDAKATWHSRKLRYLEHLKLAPEEVLLISCADKLDNYHALANTIENHGFNVALKNFNAPLKDQLWFAGEIVEIFKNRLDGHPLVNRLSQTINHIKNLSNTH